MDRQEVERYEGLKECVNFHGHMCPGLAIGYKATRLGLDRLREKRSADEELVAIVENDACFVDAVQVLSGCTFGKGNLIYRDYGKMVVTFASRQTGEGIRVSLREKSFRPQDRSEHFELMQKIIKGEADEEEKRRFWELHNERSRKILETPLEELFEVREFRGEIPAKARIEPSEPCSKCGEATMKSKLVVTPSTKLCRDCAAREGISYDSKCQ